MSSCLKPYFYAVLGRDTVVYLLPKELKPFRAAWDGEYICQHHPLRGQDKAVMLVLGDVDPDINHKQNLQM